MVDPRYGVIKVLFESGHLKSIEDIFQFIPKTTVYKDLGVNFNRFDRAIHDPSIFRLAELRELAEMFNIDAKKFIDMAYEQCLAAKYRRKG
jgi:hypothetical protein